MNKFLDLKLVDKNTRIVNTARKKNKPEAIQSDVVYVTLSKENLVEGIQR